MQAGSPQGTVLGVVIFIVKFNGALVRPKIPRVTIPLESQENIISVKFIDDATTACSINLKQSLVKDPIKRQRPLNYNEHNELILPAQDNPLSINLMNL